MYKKLDIQIIHTNYPIFWQRHHQFYSEGFFDSSGSRWLASSLDSEISLFPDSNWDKDMSSCLCFSNRLKRLDFFSSNGDWVLGDSVKLWTCCRQTWTASCTRTKNHSLPIRSTTPDFVSVRRTSRFGLETAIWNYEEKDLVKKLISMIIAYGNLDFFYYLDVTWFVFVVQVF